MKLIAATEAHAAALLELEALASAPMARFVFADDALARRVTHTLHHAGASELPVSACRVLVDDRGGVAGFIACLDKKALDAARLRAPMVLLKAGIEITPATRERLRRVGTIMTRVQASDHYLARIAVREEARGQGLGERLLTEAGRLARERGAQRLVLDVAAEHEPARRMYARHGLVTVAEATIDDPESGRTLTYANLALELGADRPEGAQRLDRSDA